MIAPGGHRLATLLGQGGATETRLAVDAGGHVVGVDKRLAPGLRGNAAAEAQLRTEGRVLSRLAGRGAPRLLRSHLEGVEPPSVAWLLIEYLPFSTLGALAAAAGGAAERSALVAEVAGRALEVLADVHDAADERGPALIVHGDVRPENLLVGRGADGAAVVRVIDFGLARDRDASGVTGAVRGAARYMAPEVARGEAATVQSDLFALGLTLLHAASGEAPRSRLQALAPLLVDAAEQPVADYAARSARALPTPLRELLVALVAFDPSGRPKSARDACAHARAESW